MTERDETSEKARVYKNLEVKLRNENREYQEKVARLNSDQYLLLKEIDNLNKVSNSLSGHNNMEQKIRHLNKLKAENSKLKEDKIKLAEELTKALDQRDSY
mmetsp:Transcript_12999/g.11114  ORF Transcript_12999/g.11114 Transcript_12999/m.11114 type:complete len:101 (+) Transcript_12999:360-662(+)